MARTKVIKKMPCTYGEFTHRMGALGYVDTQDQTVEERPFLIYAVKVRTSGNATVKCEIKPDRYTVGYGLNAKNLELLKESLSNTGYDIHPRGRYLDVIYHGTPTVNVIFEKFQELISAVVSIDDIVAQQRGLATRVFTREEAEQNIFETVAKRYRNAIDSRDQYLLDNHRVMLSADSIDHIVTIGESVNRTPSNSYREHIVPCVMIHNQVIELTLNDTPVTEVAQFIKKNLAIVLVTPEEAEKMDVKLGLRTTMPQGWNWGDSVFARLEAAGIALK